MGAVWLRARVQLRGRVRASLLLAANLVAAVPGRAAGRLRPAAALRSE